MQTKWDRAELEQVVEAYLATMARARSGETTFDTAAVFYAEDATYEEPSIGRITGRDAIVDSYNAGTEQLDGWAFPHQWVVIDGDRVVYSWKVVLPVRRPDGSNFEGALGVTVMTYAGDGQFSHVMDLYDRLQLGELLGEAGLEL